MTIELCFGSSCHVKGSSAVYEMLKEAIKINDLEKKVKIAGTLCLGHCNSGGANMKIDGEIVTGVTKENFDQIFSEKVKGPLLAE